jgi:hypothetical protein
LALVCQSDKGSHKDKSTYQDEHGLNADISYVGNEKLIRRPNGRKSASSSTPSRSREKAIRFVHFLSIGDAIKAVARWRCMGSIELCR